MPKVKPTQTEESSRVVRACISSNMELYGISEDLMAAKMGVTTRTVQNRRVMPRNFTLEELWALSKTLKWTPIQAAEIALGRTLSSKEIKEFIVM